MGILDAVLGRNFQTKKFEDLLYAARSEIDFSLPSLGEYISKATSKVTNLLKKKKHIDAYRKVNLVILQQNHLDACNIIISYLSLLIDNIDSFKAKSDIPEEHLEAVSSLIFAAPRIRLDPRFTAIQEVREMLLSHFGQNLAAQYLEIRNNCGINPQIIEKLSKEPSLREVRMKLLEEIAGKENIVLKPEEASTSTEGTLDKAKLASEEIVEDETRKGSELSDPSGKKKQIDVADADKAEGNSSNGPEKQQEEGNDDGSAKRGNMKKKGKEKQTDVTEKALGSSSNGPGNKQTEQKQKGNENGLAKGRKKKHTDVVGKELGSSSNSGENEKSEEKEKGKDDGSAKRGNMKHKDKEKQTDDVTEKALGNSSNGPENKKSEQKGNKDGLAKGGKKNHSDVVGKALGSPSNGPENGKSEQEEEEGSDVSSESLRLMALDLVEKIKLDKNVVELLDKDIEIDWSVADSEDVDHILQLDGETKNLKRPLSVTTRNSNK